MFLAKYLLFVEQYSHAHMTDFARYISENI